MLRKQLLRPVQLLGIAVVAIAFMGADVDARFNKLGHQLMCMCGCNQVLLECNHVGCAYSERMRGELTASLERGDNDSLALQGFVQKYGNTVLSAPTTTGFNRVAWIMPFAVFAAASVLTLWLVRLWKSRPVAQLVARPNLGSAELDELRKKARKETEF
ncbi:MAG TPA: cytochrome c-type biogenesis protein CcmH [Terriglobales bacterium]|jgi:cytochrome c-type biogenesis protein CcmH/NrfF